MSELNKAQLDFVKKEHENYISKVLEHRTTPKLEELNKRYTDIAGILEQNLTGYEEFIAVINDMIFEETYIAFCKGFEDGIKSTNK